MKKILMFCCSILVYGMAVAQSTPVATKAPASTKNASQESTSMHKTEFADKAGQLNKLLSESKIDEASVAWKELDKMMTSQLALSMSRIRAAKEANNTTELQRYSKNMITQRGAYFNLTEMQNKPEVNKTRIVDELNRFSATVE